jgi:phosphatidylglycerophosphatase A
MFVQLVPAVTEVPRSGPAPYHPAVVIATWFGIGRLPLAPGSWGSLAALPFAWVITSLLGPRALLLAALALFLLGWWAAGRIVRVSADKDPGSVVVDEVVGQWLTLGLAFVLAPQSVAIYVAGFLLFRLMDIVKPWPARWIDQHLGGGLGIMLDDVVAGFYAFIALLLLEVMRRLLA